MYLRLHPSIHVKTSTNVCTERDHEKPETTTHNLLRAHHTELDFSDLPDGGGGVWECERHDR